MDFISFYIEIPIMVIMYLVWVLVHHNPFQKGQEIALPIDAEDIPVTIAPTRSRWLDLVETSEVDLHKDEYKDDVADLADNEERDKRLSGRTGWLWRIYYWAA